MDSLRNRNAFIIGASRGIGAATARAFSREGAAVALISRDIASLDQLAAELKADGGKAAAFAADVTDETSLATAFQEAIDHFGGIDIAFNNSGVSSKAYRLHETPVEEFDRLISVNLRGMFLALRLELAAMLAQGGVIINNASISGLSVVPNISAYNASKHGVVGLTKSAAAEYARKGIRVNAVAPGAIMTEMLATGIASTAEGLAWIGANVPLGRIGEAADVANTVAWLASDAASYLTGVVLPIDGGYLVSRGGGKQAGAAAKIGGEG
jgi:NAD(P)-dependent dehydrogenase (short-subunit alcohol dehydrogenase family)